MVREIRSRSSIKEKNWGRREKVNFYFSVYDAALCGPTSRLGVLLYKEMIA